MTAPDHRRRRYKRSLASTGASTHDLTAGIQGIQAIEFTTFQEDAMGGLTLQVAASIVRQLHV